MSRLRRATVSRRYILNPIAINYVHSAENSLSGLYLQFKLFAGTTPEQIQQVSLSHAGGATGLLPVVTLSALGLSEIAVMNSMYSKYWIKKIVVKFMPSVTQGLLAFPTTGTQYAMTNTIGVTNTTYNAEEVLKATLLGTGAGDVVGAQRQFGEYRSTSMRSLYKPWTMVLKPRILSQEAGVSGSPVEGTFNYEVTRKQGMPNILFISY